MRRRQLLAALPFVVGVTGCLDNAGRGEPSTGSPEVRGTATPTAHGEHEEGTVGTRGVSPGPVAVRLRSAYRYVVNVDGIDVQGPERDQFAFVSPPVDGTERQTGTPDGPEERRPATPEGPSPDAFTLVLGDRQFEPTALPSPFDPWTPGIGTVYTPETRDGWLAFDVPAVETERAQLVYDGVRYPLGVDRERLAGAPAFRLESVSVPESVAPDESIELGVTVTNEGDRAGTFLAGFRVSGLPQVVDVSADPDSTESESVAYDPFSGVPSMTFDFDYAGSDRNYEVAVEAGTETGAG